MKNIHKTSRRTTDYTIEEFDFGDDSLCVELSVTYAIEPYDPGYRYNRNGDGCPPSGGGVEDLTFEVKSAQGSLTDYVGADLAAIQTAVNSRIDTDDALYEKILQHCDQDAGDGWAGDDDGRRNRS